MAINGNGGSSPNYEPNSHNGPVENKSFAWKPTPVKGFVGRNLFENRGDIDME